MSSEKPRPPRIPVTQTDPCSPQALAALARVGGPAAKSQDATFSSAL